MIISLSNVCVVVDTGKLKSYIGIANSTQKVFLQKLAFTAPEDCFMVSWTSKCNRNMAAMAIVVA